MPRIYLKPNSPEYADRKKQPERKVCDMPGCKAEAEHRAPKDRDLSGHYWFCLDHVREYNKAWNYFSGMSAAEVEDYMNRSLYGDRPTWKYGVEGDLRESLFRSAWKTYHFSEKDPPRDRGSSDQKTMPQAYSPEYEALEIMGLRAPITLPAIKARYKELAKQHHPDRNRGCKESEELLKTVNMAYTILKLAYAKFEKLPDRA